MTELVLDSVTGLIGVSGILAAKICSSLDKELKPTAFLALT